MIKSIIIDDNESYRKKLQKIISTSLSTKVEVLGEASNIIEGKELIDKLSPELVFLDIEMPGGSGFDLLGQLGQINFDVIFTTSHNEFGIQAIKYSALDYLLKPLDADELVNAVKKHEEKKQLSSSKQIEVLLQNLRNTNNPTNQVGLPTVNGLVFLKLNDIIRCKSDNNYTDFFLTNKTKITVSRTLKEIEALLRENSFIRVHDSHIINLIHIKQYIKGDGGVAVMVDGSEVDVSRRKKDEFKQRLADLKMVLS